MRALFWKGCSVLLKPFAKIVRILDRIIDAFAFAAGLLLSFILLSVCTEVIIRYFLNRPLQWVIELSEYALLYITFLGTAWLMRDIHLSALPADAWSVADRYEMRAEIRVDEDAHRCPIRVVLREVDLRATQFT